MIAHPESLQPHSSIPLPRSRRVYLPGKVHADVRVPMREIELSPTRSMGDRLEPNEPVRVYDTSGPWGDPAFTGTVEQGLPALRADWIRGRGDVTMAISRRPTPRPSETARSDRSRTFAPPNRLRAAPFGRVPGIRSPSCGMRARAS
jgi:phosphomethylpyrimidine synthase